MSLLASASQSSRLGRFVRVLSDLGIPPDRDPYNKEDFQEGNAKPGRDGYQREHEPIRPPDKTIVTAGPADRLYRTPDVETSCARPSSSRYATAITAAE